MAFNLRKMFGKDDEDEYVEIDLESVKTKDEKIMVKPFILKTSEGVDDILNALREGYTIAIIDIKPIKTKDVVELKRAISKIKKTVEALEGSIAGFGDNTIIATPAFAHIHKPVERKPKEKPDFLS